MIANSLTVNFPTNLPPTFTNLPNTLSNHAHILLAVLFSSIPNLNMRQKRRFSIQICIDSDVQTDFVVFSFNALRKRLNRRQAVLKWKNDR
jgi:hypothetical protein